jgi:hypothetical protein
MRCGPTSAVLGCIVALSACRLGPPQPLTDTPYRDLIGSEYRVVVNNLHAYGVYNFPGETPEKTLAYATLIPGVGIGGSEIAFRKHIPEGTILRIESAWRQWNPIAPDTVYYVVTLQAPDLLPSVPVQVDLSRGNEGEGVGLNPHVYAKLPPSQ